MLNGISALNLLDKVTDLISSNADEINENDEVSQGVNHTHDKSDISHNLANMSNYAWESIRSLPLKNCSAFYAALLSLSIQTNAPPESHDKPSVKHELCSQYKNSPKYFQGGTACQQSN